MDRNCSQTNIPQVDNTQPDCKDIVKEQCVVATTKRTTPINIGVGESYDSIIDKMLRYIRDLEDRVNTLEG